MRVAVVSGVHRADGIDESRHTERHDIDLTDNDYKKYVLDEYLVSWQSEGLGRVALDHEHDPRQQ